MNFGNPFWMMFYNYRRSKKRLYIDIYIIFINDLPGEGESGLLISVLGKLNRFCLTGLITRVLLM